MTKRKPDAHPARPWTEIDAAMAAAMWKRLVTDPRDKGLIPAGMKRAAYVEIAKALGRSAMAVQGRYRDCGVDFGARVRGATAAAPARDAEMKRIALAAARARQPATSALLGDPPPGFSALDQRSGLQ